MSGQEERPIRVLLVDDHPTMRYGLKVFLSAQVGIECVGEAEGGEQAMHLCRQLRPDVALLDMVMPGQDGPATIEAMARETPEVRVIALTTYTDTVLARRAIRAGAVGYLLKTVPTAELVAAVRKVYAGQQVFMAEVTQALAMQDEGTLADPPALTQREVMILRLVADGDTDDEIAKHLSISKSTARFHLKRIFAKLNAANRTEAARIALDQHLV